MKAFTLVLALITFSISAAAQATDPVVSMDDEPHYSRVFSNEYCRAYTIELGRLEETKPVAHEHDWVRMTLNGNVQSAWGQSTVFVQRRSAVQDASLYVHFLWPTPRLVLRNPDSEPYRAVIVEIMQPDNSRNQLYDPSLDHFQEELGPGVDLHASYLTHLTKTAVNIVNGQLVPGDAKQLRSYGVGDLFVAMTDLELQRTIAGKDPETIQLSNGELKWLPGGANATFKNVGREPARFVILEMK